MEKLSFNKYSCLVIIYTVALILNLWIADITCYDIDLDSVADYDDNYQGSVRFAISSPWGIKCRECRHFL